MYTVKNRAQNEIKIKKSKFIATVFPVSSLKEAKRRRDEIKTELKNATHYPYALRIGNEKIIERFSDDGEPPRSSGLPILQELKKGNVTNTLLVVTRYFGGLKLGLGGLNRAYRESAQVLLNAVRKIRSIPTAKLHLSIQKRYSGKVRNLLEHFETRILNETYTDKTEYNIEIDKSQKQELLELLKNITKGRIGIEEIKPDN